MESATFKAAAPCSFSAAKARVRGCRHRSLLQQLSEREQERSDKQDGAGVRFCASEREVQPSTHSPDHTTYDKTTELCSKHFGSYTCTSTHQRALRNQQTPSHDSLLHHRVVAVLALRGANVAVHPEEIPMREARAAPASDVSVHAGKKLKIGRKHDVA